jgi:hypothetical protein
MTQSSNGKPSPAVDTDLQRMGTNPGVQRGPENPLASTSFAALVTALAPAILELLRRLAEPSSVAKTSALLAYGPPSSVPARPSPTINLHAGVDISANAVSTLREILQDAGLTSATITSGRRSVEDQARIMHDNCSTFGVARQRALYGSNGDQVISTYEAGVRAGKTRAAIQQDMAATIRAVGPTRVSNHLDRDCDTYDVAHSSIPDGPAFVAALERARLRGKISTHLEEGSGMSYHITQPLVRT